MKRLLICLLILCLLPLAALAEETDALYPVRVDGLWGYMNREGEIVIEPQFFYAAGFRGRYAVAFPNDDWSYCGIIDADGNWAVEPDTYEIRQRSYMGRYTGGRDTGIYKLWSGDVQGFFDIPSGYFSGLIYDQVVTNWTAEVDAELVRVANGYKTGFARRTDGEIVIPCRYEYWHEYDFHGGYCAVFLDDANQTGRVLIDRTGSEVPLPENCSVGDDVGEGFVGIWDYTTRLFGYMDLEGNVVIEPQYMSGYPFSEGLACVILPDEGASFLSTDVQCAIITPENEIVAILPEPMSSYASTYQYTGGLLQLHHYSELREMDYIVFLDREGREAFRLEMEGLVYAYEPFENGVGLYETAVFPDDGGVPDVRYGLYSVQGGILTAPIFRGEWDPDIYPTFEEGLCALTDAETGKMGFVDATGQWAIAPDWDSAENFYHGLAMVEKDGKLAYIDQAGTVVWEEK